MGNVNLFKIDNCKKDDFVTYLSDNNIKEKEVIVSGDNYKFYLSVDLKKIQTNLGWVWVLKEFEEGFDGLLKFPQGILYTFYNNNMYAIPFGSAYSNVNKYCDKNFAFNLARKFNYEQVKSTSQSNPNANKNKTINSYVNNKYLEYDSGEGFLKIKGSICLDKDFDLFKKNIEIGTSVKFSMKDQSLSNLVKLIKYVDKKYQDIDITNIPLFQKINDKNKIKKLNGDLNEKLNVEDIKISFSDFDIIGTNEVFYSQNSKYSICCKRKHKDVDILDLDEIKKFCKEKDLDYVKDFYNIRVKICSDNKKEKESTLKELIDFCDDDEECVLICGNWYQYNNDYLNALKESLKDLDCVHDSTFDWDDDKFEKILLSKITELKKLTENEKLSDEELRKLAKNKNYNEKIYNCIMEQKYGYTCEDRAITQIKSGEKFEICDLYKDKCIYAVKIGDSSGKLCYVVNQMNTAMKMIKTKTAKYTNTIEKVTLVLVLKYKNHYPLNDVCFDINSLKLLALKDSINSWQKEARKCNYIPKVIIGYKK